MKALSELLFLLQVVILSASVAFGVFTFKLVENADTYFVMNIGRYVLENGFPHVDPFTIHENLQLVAQQWLSGIFFWEAYKFLGADGLRLLDFIIGAALVVTYWRLCLLVSEGNKYLSLALSFAIGVIISNWLVPRPHIISTLILLIEVFMLEKFTRTKDFKFLLALPVLSVLLINFHAAMWLMSLVICLPFLFVKDIRHVKFLSAAMAGIFICGLINPYGFDAMTYVFRSYGIDLINQGVREMATPTAHDLRGKIFYLAEAVMIFTFAKFKVSWRYILLSGGIIFMAIMHGRNVFLFYFLATFPLAYALKDFRSKNFFMLPAFFLLLAINTVLVVEIFKCGLENIPIGFKLLFFSEIIFLVDTALIVKVDGSIINPKVLPKKNLALFIIAAMLCGIFFITQGKESKSDETYTAAIEFLLRSERPENISLYVNQGYGGLAGMFGIKYYIDSRSEVFLPANNGQKNILEEYLDLRHGKIYYADFFTRYDFTHIITTSEDYMLYEALSRDKNFRVIYESERAKGYEIVHCKIFAPKKGLP